MERLHALGRWVFCRLLLPNGHKSGRTPSSQGSTWAKQTPQQWFPVPRATTSRHLPPRCIVPIHGQTSPHHLIILKVNGPQLRKSQGPAQDRETKWGIFVWVCSTSSASTRAQKSWVRIPAPPLRIIGIAGIIRFFKDIEYFLCGRHGARYLNAFTPLICALKIFL